VALVVRRQRQRSQSVGLPRDQATLRSRLHVGSPARGQLSAPATRHSKSAVELGVSPQTTPARRRSGNSDDGTLSTRSPRRLPSTPGANGHSARRQSRQSSRTSLGSVASVSSYGSQCSLNGHERDLPEVSRQTVATAVGNSSSQLNISPATKASPDSIASMTYESQVPAVCIHHVDEEPGSPAPASVLLASKTIAPLSVRVVVNKSWWFNVC
jgi:hypothetical protein